MMIVDCFPFFNELDLLEIRLHKLAPVVDRFVLVEATETFTGKPKPLYVQENKERFAQFPIEHVVIDRHPADVVTPWQRENYPRHVLFDRLRAMALSSSDIVLLSDLDEIPRADCVSRCLQTMRREVPGTVYVFLLQYGAIRETHVSTPARASFPHPKGQLTLSRRPG